MEITYEELEQKYIEWKRQKSTPGFKYGAFWGDFLEFIKEKGYTILDK